MNVQHIFNIKKYLIIIITLIFVLQPLITVNASFLYVDNTDLNYLYKKTDNVYEKVTDEEKNTIIAEINNLLENFENLTSVNIESSDTSKINSAMAQTPVFISNYVVDLFVLSKNYYQTTNGAFNIATFNLTKLWGFSPDNSGKYNESRAEPIPDNIETAKALADIDFVVFEDANKIYQGEKDNYIILYNTDNPYIIKSNKDIKIDFGAIAKGYICDKAGEIVESHNINRGALKIISNIYLIGNRVVESNETYIERDFTINIENPRSYVNNNTNCLLVENVTDKAITTSADNYRYYIYNNKVYSHIINPFTGKPVDNGIISVSVFTNSGAKADAYSTAGFVMGLSEAIKFFNDNNINAVIITSDYKYTVVGNLQVSGSIEEKSSINFSLILSICIIIISIAIVVFLIIKSEK